MPKKNLFVYNLFPFPLMIKYARAPKLAQSHFYVYADAGTSQQIDRH